MVYFQIAILLVLIVFNGLLSMSELAIVSARTSRLQQRADDNVRGAATAMRLAEEPARFLSSVQIGITLIGIVTGVFGGAALAGPVESVLSHVPVIGDYAETVSVIAVVIVVTYLSLVIGELVPKRIALQQSENIACMVAPAMATLAKVAAPIISFLAWSNETVIGLLGIKETNEPEITEEEIELLLAQGTEAGVFPESERAMVSGVFNLGDRSASELMTPRHRTVFLDLAKPMEENLALMAESRHSQYPVCEGSTDNVVGVVSARDLWARHVMGKSTTIRDAMHPALFVPEVAAIPMVIEQMRHQRATLAVVVDEYGGIEGVLTLNDVLSDVVGEIDDPFHTNIKGGVRREDGSWLLDGVFPAHEMLEVLDLDEIPGEAEGHFETVGGFMMDQMERIPEAGDAFTLGAYRYEVMDMDGIRIDKVLVTPIHHLVQVEPED